MFISPKDIIVDFLRTKLTDPRARAESTNTETFDGGGTTFQLTPTVGKMACVTAVSVSSVLQNKWTDYYIDLQNQKVIFYSATGAGTLNVSITYKQGTTNWIFPDKAKETLNVTSFPRISIMKVSGSGQRIGQYNAPVEKVNRFQVDIWVKEDYTATIGTIIYAEEKLAEYFAYQVQTAFEDNEKELFSQLYNYTLLSGPNDLGFERSYQCFHEQLDVELKSINEGIA